MAKIGVCPMCARERSLTFHHLVPRTVHSNKWFKKRFTREQMAEGIHVCRQCHATIHDLIPDEKELGRDYHTVDAILAHPEFAKYLAWARKQKR